MRNFRAALLFAGFMLLTLPLLPVQYALVRRGSRFARTLPHWYHRRLCRLLGVRARVTGAVEPGKPVLIVSNHASWLDIPVLSAVAPLSFIAKSDIDSWPFINWLARLQRSVFVQRDRRATVRTQALEIAGRLKDNECLVLFAEGTSNDGNRVLPFKSSLFAAVGDYAGGADTVLVQTVTLVYTRLHGLPITRYQRPLLAWYGDMDVVSHAWQLLRAGPIDVEIRIEPPVSMSDFKDRKALAAFAESSIRRNFTEMLTSRTRAAPLNGQ
jgi:1-acyl-sn-glycerol-3-phosphate acyltransferase